LRLKTLSDDFINKLASFSAGSLSSQDFDKLLKLFEAEIKKHYFTHSSESNLLRIINGMYDKYFFLSECLRYPHHIEILVSIASNSNYLSDILVINPEYFSFIVNPSLLTPEIEKEKFSTEVSERISRYNSLDGKTHALNSFKRREILRIGLKDILRSFEVGETTKQLSTLATTLTSQLFESCYQFILNKYKIQNIAQEYCIISLGKLGGNELNYSSDIDIIIFYDFDNKIGNRYYSEILSESIGLFLDKCSTSEAGSLYRIDLRLRPDGKSSAVCRSLQEYLDYYESRGSDWERQMLIKAGFLGGSKKLYSQFTKYIDRFVFPSVHFTSPLEQMKKLRKIIEREGEDSSNIKTIAGGIRDIEFTIQALQLLNAGKNSSLKTGNTLVALEKLESSKHLTKSETKTLREAYIFYRRIEHFLQLMNNTQTHTIPESGEIAEKLSHYLGFISLKEFKDEVRDCRKQVRNIYNSILGEKKKSKVEDNIFDRIKFENPQRAATDIVFLREGKGLTVNRKFDKTALEAFNRVEENINKYLVNSDNPDLCLSNFVRVIKQADFPSIWYREFYDENFLNIFLQLCERSQLVVDLFAEDKILREGFLGRDFLNEFSVDEINRVRLKNILFRLAVQLTIKLIKPNIASEILSNAVQEKIKSAANEFSKKKKWKIDFVIIALGSTGTGSMTFGSDVDLIFAVKNSGKYQKIQNAFQDLLGILKIELSPFSVDCRLRPEGASSQLVWDFDKYKEYLNNRARIWELQSFLKAGYVIGNEKLFGQLSESFKTRLSKLSEEEIVNGINEIRTKSLSTFPAEMNLIDLKKNSGGLNDIEYVAHYHLLLNPDDVLSSIGKAIPQIFKEQTAKSAGKKVLNELADNYIFIKNLEIFNQLAFGSTSSKVSTEENKSDKLARSIGIESGAALNTKLNSVLQFNRESYTAIIRKK